ncbi:MAG: biopolymer transporter ExbD [Pirellulaceae bacterium]
MKRPSSYLRRDGAGDSDQAMTSMIDVIFLLLVFFVCTSSFQIIEHILPSQMSSTLGTQPVEALDPPPDADFDNVVIRIGWDGSRPNWKINDTPIESFEQIRAHLQALASVKVDAPLILHPDPAVPLGYVIQSYDEAKLTGFQKVSFAVNPRKGG